jgi:ubiquinone/menaquinone biosynthesis C-methylase UbiE
MQDNQKFLETHSTWNALAEWYEKKFMDFEAYDEAYDRWIALLPKQNVTALDLGSGPGIIPYYTKKKGLAFHWTLVDVAPAMLERAKMYMPAAECVVSDIERFESKEQVYDTITAGFVWPYLPPENNSQLMVKISKWLKPNGRLFLSFVEGDHHAETFGSNSLGMWSVFYYHSIEKITELLIQHGFDVELVHKCMYPKNGGEECHVSIIAQKLNSTKMT